jgi:hypothetical protein
MFFNEINSSLDCKTVKDISNYRFVPISIFFFLFFMFSLCAHENLKKIHVYLSSVSSSNMFKSHAMYSSAASVIRGHQLRSNARSFWRFSAINSTPSSVILLHPDSDNTVKCGNEWTANKDRERERGIK